MSVRNWWVLLTFAVVCLQAPAVSAQTSRDARWQQDLAFLAQELPRRHANLFFKVSRAAFDSAVADLARSIPSLTDAEVIAGLARIAALPGDAHTSLNLPQQAAPLRQLPLAFQWFEDGLYVTAAAPEFQQALATRVVQIGAKTVQEALAAVSAVISHENQAWLLHRSPQYFRFPDVLKAVGVTADAASVRFVLEDLAAQRFSLDVAATSTAPSLSVPDAATGFIPLYRKNSAQNYWFTYLESSRVLYFRYSRCQEMPSLPFADFAAQLFSVFDSRPVDLLVFDLRDNGGGDSRVVQPFFDGLQQRIARLGSPTRLFLIMGRGTFSSAMLNAQVVKEAQIGMGLTFIRLVGEPTGGKPASYGEVLSFAVPNSGLVISYSTRFFESPFTTDSLLPDVTVPFLAADYFARHDPFLAAVLADSTEAPPALPAGAVAITNGASFRAGVAVAPGSLASAFGDFRGTTADAAALPLPRELAGTQVLLNDLAAPLLVARPNQINLQVPAGLAAGPASVRVMQGASAIATGTVAVADTGPGLFIAQATNAARPGAVLNQDFRPNSESARARRGEVVLIYATGPGRTAPAVEDGAPAPAAPLARVAAETSVYVGAERAEVLFSGLAPGFAGLWQINARVPTAASIAGQAPVFVSLPGRASNAVTIWIEP